MVKGTVIGEKKGLMPPLKDKKKGSTAKTPTKSKEMSSQVTTPAVVPGEGTSTDPGVDLRLNVFVLENPRVVEKLIHGSFCPPIMRRWRNWTLIG